MALNEVERARTAIYGAVQIRMGTPLGAMLDDLERAVERRERTRWRVEYDDPEAVLAAAGDLSPGREALLREALAAFAESVRAAAGLDMLDFEFMVDNTAAAFEAVTGGLVSKPMTSWRVVDQLVQERTVAAVDEALAEERENR